MICTNCGKKIETAVSVCKYCKEPVIREGVAPVNVVVTREKPAESPAYVSMETYAETSADNKKKIAIMAAGALCALLVIFGLAALLLPNAEKEDEGTDDKEPVASFKMEETEFYNGGFTDFCNKLKDIENDGSKKIKEEKIKEEKIKEEKIEEEKIKEGKKEKKSKEHEKNRDSDDKDDKKGNSFSEVIDEIKEKEDD